MFRLNLSVVVYIYYNDISDDVRWCIDKDILHRENGPAYEFTNGRGKFWYLNNKRHRDNGPAIEQPSVSEWFVYGKRHREDGPAIVSKDFKEWWLNGKFQRNEPNN